jgi:hypothetical protein
MRVLNGKLDKALKLFYKVKVLTNPDKDAFSLVKLKRDLKLTLKT